MTVTVQPLHKALIRGILAILILVSKITNELVSEKILCSLFNEQNSFQVSNKAFQNIFLIAVGKHLKGFGGLYLTH